MKKIQWVKIHLDLCQNKKMRYLKNLPQGSAIAYIWVLLLLIGGESNADGCLMVHEGVPYDANVLASALDYPVALIKKALNEFLQLDMIIIEDKVIRIKNWEKYQSTKKMAKIREDNAATQKSLRLKAKIARSS